MKNGPQPASTTRTGPDTAVRWRPSHPTGAHPGPTNKHCSLSVPSLHHSRASRWCPAVTCTAVFLEHPLFQGTALHVAWGLCFVLCTSDGCAMLCRHQDTSWAGDHCADAPSTCAAEVCAPQRSQIGQERLPGGAAPTSRPARQRLARRPQQCVQPGGGCSWRR